MFRKLKVAACKLCFYLKLVVTFTGETTLKATRMVALSYNFSCVLHSKMAYAPYYVYFALKNLRHVFT